MSPFTASVSIRQCQDGPYLAVISSIPSVITRGGEQHIFPGLSFLCTPSLLIPDPLLISSAQCVIYFKCFMVSVSAVVDELNLRHTPATCATRTSANVNYCTDCTLQLAKKGSSNLKLIVSTEFVLFV